MKTYLKKLTFLLIGFLSAAIATPAMAADPEIVGILADAVDPQVAKSLELSDEQIEQLNELIVQQESRMLDINDQMRELPPADGQELLRNRFGPWKQRLSKSFR